jgi:hypothetical protein
MAEEIVDISLSNSTTPTAASAADRPSLAQEYRALSSDASHPLQEATGYLEDALSSLWGEPSAVKDTSSNDHSAEATAANLSKAAASGIANAYSSIMGSLSSGSKSAKALGSSPSSAHHRRTSSNSSLHDAYNSLVNAASSKLAKLSDRTSSTDDQSTPPSDRPTRSSSLARIPLPPSVFSSSPVQTSSPNTPQQPTGMHRHTHSSPTFHLTAPISKLRSTSSTAAAATAAALPSTPHSPIADDNLFPYVTSSTATAPLPSAGSAPVTPSASLGHTRSLVLQSSKQSTAASACQRPSPWQDSSSEPGYSSSSSMPLDALGLATLAAQGRWQAMLSLLASGQAGSKQEQLQRSCYKVLAHMKLRDYAQAASELSAAQELMLRGSLGSGGGSRGSSRPGSSLAQAAGRLSPELAAAAAPFALMHLQALLQLKLGRVQEGMDALYELVAHCRQQLEQLQQQEQQEQQAGVLSVAQPGLASAQAAWRRRQQLVAGVLLSEHLQQQQAVPALQLLDQLLVQAPREPELWAAVGRVQLVMGDLAAAAATFRYVEQLAGPEVVAAADAAAAAAAQDAASAAAAAAAWEQREQEQQEGSPSSGGEPDIMDLVPQAVADNLIMLSPPTSPMHGNQQGTAATAAAFSLVDDTHQGGSTSTTSRPASAAQPRDLRLQQLLHRNRSCLLLASHEPAAARAELAALLALDPQEPAARSNAALASLALGQLDEAVSELEAGLNRWPQSLLQEQLLRNFGSMYELQAGPAAPRMRQLLCAWASRVMPDDFELSCVTS